MQAGCADGTREPAHGFVFRSSKHHRRLPMSARGRTVCGFVADCAGCYRAGAIREDGALGFSGWLPKSASSTVNDQSRFADSIEM